MKVHQAINSITFKKLK